MTDETTGLQRRHLLGTEELQGASAEQDEDAGRRACLKASRAYEQALREAGHINDEKEQTDE
jgi:hypothetical protein